ASPYGAPTSRGAVICYPVGAGPAAGPRLLRDIDVLAIDHFQDRGDAGSVTHSVHGDRSRHAGEILQRAETLADFVAIAGEISGLISDASFLEAVFERIDDVVGARAAVGRQRAVHLGLDLLDECLHLRARVVEPGRGRHVSAFGSLAGDLDVARCAGAGAANDRNLEILLLHLLGDRRGVLIAG